MTPDFWDRLLDLLRENFIAFSLGQPMLNVIDKKKDTENQKAGE